MDIIISVCTGVFMYWSFLIIGAMRGAGSWRTFYDATSTVVALSTAWAAFWLYITFIKHDEESMGSLGGYHVFMLFSLLGMFIGYFSRAIYLKRASNESLNVESKSLTRFSAVIPSRGNMELELKHKYLADENEREDGAKYYLSHFSEGEEKALKLRVGPVNDLLYKNKLENYVKSKLFVVNIESIKEGFIFKKHYIDISLDALNIDYDNMLKVANVQYDIILALELKVEVNEVV